jgi:hypothetical protein
MRWTRSCRAARLSVKVAAMRGACISIARINQNTRASVM